MAETADNTIVVLPLHNYPQYTDECCRVLNAEWPRSLTARKHELSKSSDELPCSLVLVKKCVNSERDEVIGHSQVGLVAGQPHYCSIKSVVIKNEYRGRGMGKRLMIDTEAYALNLGFQCCCLTTHDQQGFYTKLGYSECTPMCFLASGKSSFTSQVLEMMETSKCANVHRSVWSQNEAKGSEKLLSKDTWPPLPPPMPIAQHNNNNHNNKFAVTWMKKDLKL